MLFLIFLLKLLIFLMKVQNNSFFFFSFTPRNLDFIIKKNLKNTENKSLYEKINKNDITYFIYHVHLRLPDIKI